MEIAIKILVLFMLGYFGLGIIMGVKYLIEDIYSYFRYRNVKEEKEDKEEEDEEEEEELDRKFPIYKIQGCYYAPSNHFGFIAPFNMEKGEILLTLTTRIKIRKDKIKVYEFPYNTVKDFTFYNNKWLLR